MIGIGTSFGSYDTPISPKGRRRFATGMEYATLMDHGHGDGGRDEIDDRVDEFDTGA